MNPVKYFCLFLFSTLLYGAELETQWAQEEAQKLMKLFNEDDDIDAFLESHKVCNLENVNINIVATPEKIHHLNDEIKVSFFLTLLERNKNHKDAFQRLEKLAQTSLRAMNRLGCCYFYGLGVAQSFPMAVHWVQKAAIQDYAEAQSNLASCYFNGFGINKDLPMAAELYKKAAMQGHAEAQAHLGYCYLNGFGVDKNLSMAAELFKKAAMQEYATAQHNLGYCYAEGLGVNKDLIIAFQWYEKAAKKGHPQAQNRVGYAYLYGKGVEKNPPMAILWFTKAADQGLIEAQRNLWHCFQNGLGVNRNTYIALKWYKKVEKQENSQPLENLEYNKLFDISPAGRLTLKLEDYYRQYKGEQFSKRFYKYPIRIPEIKKTIFLYQKEAICLTKNDISFYTTIFTSNLSPCLGVAVENSHKVALMHVDGDINFESVGAFIKRHFSNDKSVHIHINGLEFEEEDLKGGTFNIYKSQRKRINDLITEIEKQCPFFRCSVSLYNKNILGHEFGMTLGISIEGGVFHGEFLGKTLIGKRRLESSDVIRIESKEKEKDIISSNKSVFEDFSKYNTEEQWKAHYKLLRNKLAMKNNLGTARGMIYPLEDLSDKKVKNHFFKF